MKKNARIKINNNNHNSNKKEKINIKQIRNCFPTLVYNKCCSIPLPSACF